MKNEFKSLGELKYEEKKKYWNSTISGSIAKRVMEEPITLLRERWGLIEPVVPGEDPSVPDHTNEWTKAVMKRGTYFEDTIIRMGVDDERIPETKIDKRTFRSTINKNFTANIDGLVGKDINNIDDIVEVKYSTTQNINALIQRYIYQMIFYMWFFDVKGGCYFLVYQETIEYVEFFFNGKRFRLPKGFPRLQLRHVKRDLEEEKEMLDKLDIWFKALETYDTSLITWSKK